MDEHSGLSEIIIQSPVSYLVDDWGDSEFGDDRYRGAPGYLEFVKEQIISSYSILERVSYDTKKPFSTTALFGEYILRKAERLCKGFFSSSWEESFFGEQIATKARADSLSCSWIASMILQNCSLLMRRTVIDSVLLSVSSIPRKSPFPPAQQRCFVSTQPL